MERLIKEASKMKDIQKELNLEVKAGDMSFANIAKAISVVQKNLQIMGTTENEAMTTLTGSITAMKAAWENFLSGTGDLGTVLDNASIALDNVLRIVDEALPQITEQITANMPKILELAGKILNTLADGIIENMPIVLDTVILIIDKISEAMLQNGDKIGEISFKLMGMAVKGFLRAIPHVLLAISDIIGAALLALTKFNDKLWQKGFELLVSFVKGILGVIGRVQSAVEQIKTAIKNKLSQLGSSAYNWGRDMIEGFKNGIMGALGSLREQVSNVANSIRGMLHFSRPDEGPLRDYETWMPDMIKGMSDSLDRAAPTLLGKISDLTSAMSMSPTLNGSINSIGPAVNVVVNSSYEQDPLGQMVSTIKTFSNGSKNDYNYGYGG